MSKFDGESGYAKSFHQVSENAAWANKMDMVTKIGYSFVEGYIRSNHILVHKNSLQESPIPITTELTVQQLVQVLNEIRAFEPVKTYLEAEQKQKDLMAHHSQPVLHQAQNSTTSINAKNPTVGE